jgi:hypothetical protein
MDYSIEMELVTVKYGYWKHQPTPSAGLYFGWNGRDDLDSVRGLFAVLGELKYVDIDSI